MGSIVSANKECCSEEVHPSEVVAMQAKLRQAALAEQPGLVRKLPRSEAYGSSRGEGPDWYPAGISPWYLDSNGVIVRREVNLADCDDSGWMDHFTVTKGDLHRSATLIQKAVRGHQARSDLKRQQQCARKIQRVFRKWRRNGSTITSVTSLPILKSHSGNNDRTLSAATWSSGQLITNNFTRPFIEDKFNISSKDTSSCEEKDEFVFTWGENKTTWSQQNSLIERVHEIVDSANEANLCANSIEASDTSHHPNTSSTQEQTVSTNIQMQFPHELTSVPVRNGHSKSTVKRNPLKNKKFITGDLGGDLGQTLDPRPLYPGVTPGPTLKQKTGGGRSELPSDMFSNSAIKGMTLQNAKTRWEKPPTEHKTFNNVRTKKKVSEKENRLLNKASNHPSESYDINHPSELYDINISVEDVLAYTEQKMLKFTMQESEECSIEDKSSYCPVESVDAMLKLLSQGMNKSLDSLPQVSEEPHSEGRLEITPELVHTVHSMLKRQLTLNLGPEDFLENSILIKPSDVQTLLKTAEFRNDIVQKLKHLTTSIRLDYYQLMNDIEQTQFYAAQQVEAGMTDYQPQKLVLISSTIPKASRLRQAVRDDVLVHLYDFSCELDDVLTIVRELLDSVRPGAKAKFIGIVCKGGPGHFYIVKKTPVTPAKLRNNQALITFWRALGGMMSKLIPGQSVIHLMESNMAGNKQGEKLLVDLESVLYAHQVQVTSPLEMAAKGREMINLYFDPMKHKLWKNTRYTKLQLY